MIKSHRIRVQVAVLVVLPTLFTAQSAFAAVTQQAPPSLTVHYEDITLDSTAGVARLYKRIENAATEVCRSAEGPQLVSRMLWTAWNKCFYHAVTEAVQAVHDDRLSAYREQRVRGWEDLEAASATVATR